MPELKCVVCGCTDSNCCEGGCSWAQANPNVCSRCAGEDSFRIEAGRDGLHRIGSPGMSPKGCLLIENGHQASAIIALLNDAFAMGRRAGVASMDLSKLQQVGTAMAAVCNDLGKGHVDLKGLLISAELKAMLDLSEDRDAAVHAYAEAEKKALTMPRKRRTR